MAGQAARVHDITALRVKGAAAAETNFPQEDYAEIEPHLQGIGTVRGGKKASFRLARRSVPC